MTHPTPSPQPRGFIERLAAFAEHVAIAMLLLMTALVLAQVAARDMLHLGLPEVDELARYTGLALVYFGAPLLLLQGRHVTVELIVDALPAGLRRIVRIAIELVTLLFCGLFLWGGWAFMQRAGRFSTPALGMPNTWFYAPVIVGMVLVTIVTLVRLVRLLRGRPVSSSSGIDAT